AHTGSALYFDRGHCRLAASNYAGPLADQGPVSQRIARVPAPLLIMHGVGDPTIPIGLGERLFALAREPKQFVRFPQGGHDDLDAYGALQSADGRGCWLLGRCSSFLDAHGTSVRSRRPAGMDFS